MSALDRIEHIVVLMLENRSFDNLLGKLYPASPTFDGLTGNELNLDGRTRAAIRPTHSSRHGWAWAWASRLRQ
jgi:phospholipase C